MAGCKAPQESTRAGHRARGVRSDSIGCCNEIRRTCIGQPLQPLTQRVLVTDECHIRRTFNTFPIEHRTVRRQRAIDLEDTPGDRSGLRSLRRGSDW